MLYAIATVICLLLLLVWLYLFGMLYAIILLVLNFGPNTSGRTEIGIENI